MLANELHRYIQGCRNIKPILAGSQDKCIAPLGESPTEPILQGNFKKDSERSLLKLGFGLAHVEFVSLKLYSSKTMINISSRPDDLINMDLQDTTSLYIHVSIKFIFLSLCAVRTTNEWVIETLLECEPFRYRCPTKPELHIIWTAFNEASKAPTGICD